MYGSTPPPGLYPRLESLLVGYPTIWKPGTGYSRQQTAYPKFMGVPPPLGYNRETLTVSIGPCQSRSHLVSNQIDPKLFPLICLLRKFDTSTYILEVVTVCTKSPKRNLYIKKYIFGKATKFSKIKVGTSVVKRSFVVFLKGHCIASHTSQLSYRNSTACQNKTISFSSCKAPHGTE